MFFCLTVRPVKIIRFWHEKPRRQAEKTVLAHMQFPCQRKPKLDQYIYGIFMQKTGQRKPVAVLSFACMQAVRQAVFRKEIRHAGRL